MKKSVLIFLVAFLYFITPEQAVSGGRTLKLVFPWGEHTASYCPPANQTVNGCCKDTNRIFTKDGKKGCCQAGNDIETVQGNQGCCPAVTLPQTRWGQTSSSPCGGYCAPGNEVLYNGVVSSCCPNCTNTNDTRILSSPGNVCGTCCPITNQIVSFAGSVSCCAACAGGETRIGQIATDVCGACSACNAAGYYITGNETMGYACNSKTNSCNGTWNVAAKTWSCTACMRDGSRLSYAACTYNGANADAACTSFNCSRFCSRREGDYFDEDCTTNTRVPQPAPSEYMITCQRTGTTPATCSYGQITTVEFTGFMGGHSCNVIPYGNETTCQNSTVCPTTYTCSTSQWTY